MMFTRCLGISYICIGTSCVIQKDHSDWVGESVHKLDYYSRAYITLSSALPLDCDGWLVHQKSTHLSPLFRHRLWRRAITFSLPASPDMITISPMRCRGVGPLLPTGKNK